VSDLDRLRSEYANRRKRLAYSNTYSFYNFAFLYSRQQLERSLLELLRNNGLYLSEKSLLEIGCGSGGVLLDFLRYGIEPSRIHGIDLLLTRLIEAHHKLSSSAITNADGQNLPYSEHSFDLVIQYTAFSSILDDQIKHNMAADMLRVLKPNGVVFWYDFWLNPTNKQTRGIRPAEIRCLFPKCTFEFHKITLAPPLARKIVPLSWGLALFLESLTIFNTHYLVLIRTSTQ
jgi:ubiquinone/menaquinone biosynthesis C-methylase UbiE